MMHAFMLAANGRRDEGVAMLDTRRRIIRHGMGRKSAPAMACALRGERDDFAALVMTPELRAAAEWTRFSPGGLPIASR